MIILTYDVLPKHVLCDVLKERGEHWQQSHGGVVDDLSHPLRLSPGVSELALVEVLQSFFQVLSRVVKERP